MKDKIVEAQAKLEFLEVWEKLMQSFLFLQDNLNDMLTSITFAW